MTSLNTLVRGAAAAAAIAGASQAIAAEPFNGPYVGLQAGWQQDKNRFTLVDSTGTESTHRNGSSFAYGGQIGYDFKLGTSFVLGAEAFLTGDTNKVHEDGMSFDGGRSFGLLARAGFLATPNTLVYANGGWENGRFTYQDEIIRTSSNLDGWSIGAGVEQMLNKNVSARVEYRYTDFNRFKPDLLSTAEYDGYANVDRNRIMVGVNYRF